VRLLDPMLHGSAPLCVANRAYRARRSCCSSAPLPARSAAAAAVARNMRYAMKVDETDLSI
jgi:hypothetical protein